MGYVTPPPRTKPPETDNLLRAILQGISELGDTSAEQLLFDAKKIKE